MLTTPKAEAAESPVQVTDIDALIRKESAANGISYRAFHATLDCESEHFRDVAIQSEIPNHYGPNGREDSWGLAQINLPSHKDVTRAQAQDPQFAIAWAAKEFKRNPNQWTCYRKLQ